MRKLILKVEWTAAQAEVIAEFLGDIAVAIWNEYHDDLTQLIEARTARPERQRVTPTEDDSTLF
jgi:hypothetical protein